MVSIVNIVMGGGFYDYFVEHEICLTLLKNKISIRAQNSMRKEAMALDMYLLTILY